MTRILARPRATASSALRDPRLQALGLALGLAALTRNDAAWLALTWAGVALWWGPRGGRLGLVLVPATVAIAVFTPWVVRDWVAFGNPLPGQALANALSVTGFDIFAWNDPPTLARYLAVGPARLLELRLDGIAHNLLNVLVVPGFPIALIGLLGLPWFGRARALRPLLIVSVATFLVTSLLFPVATTWGTFLHAAGAVHVLLIASCLLVLDAFIARVGAWRRWTRPVAWLGPTLTVAVAVLFSLTLLGGYGRAASGVERRYAALGALMAAIGRPLDATAGPVITDFPIWLAEALPIRTLALPYETPIDVLDLAAAFPGTRYLVITPSPESHGRWPGVLATDAPGAACFSELDLGLPADPAEAGALAGTHVFEIGCR